MGEWHRDNPELIGTSADPWMIHESYRKASGQGPVGEPVDRDEPFDQAAALQERYDYWTARVADATRRYDRSEDGSVEKRLATKDMDFALARVHKIEAEFDG